MSAALKERIGVVVIGRNEGERLRVCLASVMGKAALAVYVDSGSTDDSVAMARDMGAVVVELDSTAPFTAARARNAGAALLQSMATDGEMFVQFVDGDCEMREEWWEATTTAMERDAGVVAVCGRLRERYPEATIYNKLCDLEWNTAVGEAKACGGIAMMRLGAFRAAGGFNEGIIAGEEPELCFRMRRAGGRIRRIDAEMALHDAAMTRFGQWWKRAKRAGHAYAEGMALHGRSVEKFNVAEVRSILLWGLLLPVAAVGFAWLTWGASLALLGGYVVQLTRIRNYRISIGDSASDADLYARFCVLGKFPQVLGVGQYWWNRMLGKRSRIIEHKAAVVEGSGGKRGKRGRKRGESQEHARVMEASRT